MMLNALTHFSFLVLCKRPAFRVPSSRRRIGTINVAMTTVLFLCGVIACEWCSLQQERQATAVLKHDYNAMTSAGLFQSRPHWTFDLRQIKHGRFYVPVSSVAFNNVAIDRKAFEQLSSFRCLDSVTFQKCRIEPAATFHLPNAIQLTDLSFWGTPLTLNHLRSIARLSHLTNLTVDGTGLKGDWLQPVSRLRDLQYFVVVNGHLSDGAANSLARMKKLETLQISNVGTTSALGPAIAKLQLLEDLVIVNTSFDDEGMEHLGALKDLKGLYLRGTAITDAGMATFKNFPRLYRVSLSNTKVGDKGLRHLSQLPHLSGLDIRQTRVTNSCLRALAAMPSLKTVLVENTAIDASLPGFIGVISSYGTWYPSEARAKEAEENSKPHELGSGKKRIGVGS